MWSVEEGRASHSAVVTVGDLVAHSRVSGSEVDMRMQTNTRFVTMPLDVGRTSYVES